MKLKVTDNLVGISVDTRKKLAFNKNYGQPLIVPNHLFWALDKIRNQTIKLNSKKDPVLKKLLKAKILVKKDITYEENIAIRINKMKGKADFELIFVPSYYCNLFCDYCLVSPKRVQCKYLIPTKLIEKIPRTITQLMQISPVGPFKYVWAKILGGEPTLDVNWKRSISLLKLLDRNFESKSHRLITNGLLLSKEKIQQFISLGGTTVQLTFDARRNASKIMVSRQNRNEPEYLVELIQRCIHEGASPLVILKINENTRQNANLFKFFRNIKDQGLDGSFELGVSMMLDPSTYDPLQNENQEEEIYGPLSYLYLKRLKLWRIAKSIQNELPLSTRLYPLTLNSKVFPCKPASLSSMLVYPNGDLTLCGKLYASLNPPLIGSLRSDPAFSKEELKEQIYPISSLRECAECDISLFCGGKCIFKKDNQCYLREARLFEMKFIARELIKLSSRR